MIKISTVDYLNNLQLELIELEKFVENFDNVLNTLNPKLFYVTHSIYFYAFIDNEYVRTRFLDSIQGLDLLSAKQLQFNINQKLSIPNTKIINQIDAYKFDFNLKNQRIYEIKQILERS
jgi:hypothetical protein